MLLKTVKVLAYFQDHQLACHHFLCASRRLRTLKSQAKDLLLTACKQHEPQVHAGSPDLPSPTGHLGEVQVNGRCACNESESQLSNLSCYQAYQSYLCPEVRHDFY